MRPFLSAVASAVLVLVATWSSPSSGQSLACLIDSVRNGPYCVGDWNHDGAVRVAEVVDGVRIAQGEMPIRECRAVDVDHNGRATVGELVRAVDAAMVGCPLPAPIFDQRLRLRIAPGDQAGDPLLLILQTEEIFPCVNSVIDAALRVSDQSIVVVLGCVLAPPICLTALGPATFLGDLDLEPGTYTLELRALAATDRYRVDVSPDGFEIEPIDAMFSSLF